jgi:hypothetical protein
VSAPSEPLLDYRRLVENIALFRPLGALLCVLAVLGGVVFGLEILKRHVQTEPVFAPDELAIVLDNPPEWIIDERWESRILDCARQAIEQVAVAAESNPSDPSATAPTSGDDSKTETQPLVQQIHKALMDSGWVSDVHRVVLDNDGVIHIDADYRRPVAMVQFTDDRDRDLYVAVDGDGVRLPELYERVEPDSGWIRIFGVQERPPEPGSAFQGKDAMAGIRIAREIISRETDEQPYWNRINGITVLNYGGRQRRDDAHIKLLRRDGGIPVIWGSAMGEEIEEPDWRDKFKTLGVALQRGIKGEYDLSVYANGIVVQKPDPQPPG